MHKKNTKTFFVKVDGRTSASQDPGAVGLRWGLGTCTLKGLEGTAAAASLGPHSTTISIKHPLGGTQTNVCHVPHLKSMSQKQMKKRVQTGSTEDFKEVRDRELVRLGQALVP